MPKLMERQFQLLLLQLDSLLNGQRQQEEHTVPVKKVGTVQASSAAGVQQLDITVPVGSTVVQSNATEKYVYRCRFSIGICIRHEQFMGNSKY
ncbi:hypothetical protein GCM10020331_033000 [Ectobacillus funiculus]